MVAPATAADAVPAPLVALDGVSKRYGEVAALDGLSAEIQGRVIGLLGPNGAGKSTLMRGLLGLTPLSGEARVLGLDPRRSSFEIRARVGYMPESECHLAGMNAVAYCVYAAELSGLPRAEAVQRAHAALYFANLGDKRYLPVDGYSTGLKQRVKLAQALVHDPELLFLDEPTNGLDPESREDMLRTIASLPEQRGASVLLSTHLLADVERYCDRVLVLDRGRLLFWGSIDELVGDDGVERYRVRARVSGPAGAGAEAGEGDAEARLGAALSARGAAVETVSEGLLVTLPADASTGLIFATALELGVQVRHLVRHRVSLEEAFLQRLRE
ncbi:ABC transporter ATP-binding protein [Haliangium ochraceum]|uniref:ABC transporter ATP-binding protein n=1 Tax=Haliangium ochraceum TaxID=80816 RepID=UPI0006A6DA55|nr:ABC transporter ATP-binding protein [Haliangium ochraceum]